MVTEWTWVGESAATRARIVAFVVFLVLTAVAFAGFYSALDNRLEAPDSGPYFAVAGIVVPLFVLASGVATMLVWTAVRDGEADGVWLRRILWLGAGCTVGVALGLIGVVLTAPEPFSLFGRTTLVALAAVLLASAVHYAGVRALTRRRAQPGV